MKKLSLEEYENCFKHEALVQQKSDKYIVEHLNIAKNQLINGVPVIFDEKHLSFLSGVSLTYLYAVANGNSNNFYRHFDLKKRNGGTRPISVPLPTLKIFQKWVLENILNHLEVNEFSKAYRKGYSLKDNAKYHRNQKFIFKMDIKDFFLNIRSKYIFRIFMECGYSASLSVLLTRCLVLNNGLPEGAPTSPALSNLVMRDFDKQVGKYCFQRKIRYTRYADDLTFSCDNAVGKDLTENVSTELKRLGLRLNKAKTKKMSNSNHQITVGILVNKKMNAPRQYRKQLRLECYYATSSHFKDDIYRKIGHYPSNDEIIRYLNVILGKVNFVLFVNPNIKQFLKYRVDLNNLLNKYRKN